MVPEDSGGGNLSDGTPTPQPGGEVLPPPGDGPLGAAPTGGSVTPKRLIVNGLLCDILKATGSITSRDELVSLIERDISDEKINVAWRELFEHFNTVMDGKKQLINISRTVKLKVRDMVDHLYIPS